MPELSLWCVLGAYGEIIGLKSRETVGERQAITYQWEDSVLSTLDLILLIGSWGKPLLGD